MLNDLQFETKRVRIFFFLSFSQLFANYTPAFALKSVIVDLKKKK